MDDCLFCKIVRNEIQSYLIYENQDVISFFDAFPASRGHSLIIPRMHYENIFQMSNLISESFMNAVLLVARNLKKALSCDGMNIVQNNGRVAGQTVFHIHFHLIPRWENDGFVNFSDIKKIKLTENEFKNLYDKVVDYF